MLTGSLWTHLHNLMQNSHDAVCGIGKIWFGRRLLSVTGWAALEDVHQGFATLADLEEGLGWASGGAVRQVVYREVSRFVGVSGVGWVHESGCYLCVVGRNLLVQLLVLLDGCLQVGGG